MARFQKYPTYTTDEPVILRQFNGGINTDPSDGNLLENELQDGLNLNYNNLTLEKRLGATVVNTLLLDASTQTHQGVFYFSTKSSSWVIVANGGKLYQAPYVPGELHFAELDVRVDDFLTIADNDANPNNLITGLPKHTAHLTGEHTGYVFKSGDTGRLIFQNTRRVEAAAIDYRLYVASGTRFLVIEEREGLLHAEIVVPKTTYGQEQKMIGFNYLSPYPEYHVENLKDAALTSISNIYNPNIKTVAGNNAFKAVMTYAQGKTAGDYRFKWELSDDNGKTWKQLTQYRDQKDGVTTQPITGTGMDSIVISDMKAGMDYHIRCSFAAAFKIELGEDKKFYYVEEANGIDWVVDKVDGEWFGQAMVEIHCLNSGEAAPPPNQTFLNIHSCAKIVADGSKLILYDDINESGCWYKTVIGKYNYITDRGSLNFQTTKNEKIVKVVNFQGVLVVFSNNDNLGGNIAVVSGNGDDLAVDNSYSPYQRKVVNTTVTTDNARSVQMSDNYLIFKHKDTLYLMDSSSLNAEILTVISVNDRVRVRNKDMPVPWENNNCYSEVTQDYYAIVWPETEERWKMYYRYPTRIGDDQKVYFPWLRDESPSFGILDVLTLNGLSTHLTDSGRLVQYTNTDYKDEDYHIYSIHLKIKPTELRYPGLIKYVQGVEVSYYRGQEQASAMEIEVRNEAGFPLIDGNQKAFMHNHSVEHGNYEAITGNVASTQDWGALVADETLLEGLIRYDAVGIETKVLIPKYLFPCMAADVSIRTRSNQRFSFVGVTFMYLSTDIADSTIYDTYVRIVKPNEL